MSCIFTVAELFASIWTNHLQTVQCFIICISSYTTSQVTKSKCLRHKAILNLILFIHLQISKEKNTSTNRSYPTIFEHFTLCILSQFYTSQHNKKRFGLLAVNGASAIGKLCCTRKNITKGKSLSPITFFSSKKPISKFIFVWHDRWGRQLSVNTLN